ncbi:MAG: hypothetical protein IJR94_04360 [Synergistaceae bacterium]|nr:hypothetical protein [Synergistaceae bacterium]
MRFIGALIKYFIYLCLIFITAGAGLFWFDTGSWLVLPLAQRAGNFFLAPYNLKLEIENINGSIRQGYSVEGLKLISSDSNEGEGENLLTLDYFSVSPDWDLVLSGMDGLPFIKNILIEGVSSDLDKTLALVDKFATTEDTSKDSTPLEIKLQPFNLSAKNINYATPYANLELHSLGLHESGELSFDSKIISRDNVLPVKYISQVKFDSLEIISSDLFIGAKSRGALTASLTPLKARVDLTALSLEELLKFAPPLDIKASGRIDGRVIAEEDSDGNITARGVVSMPRAEVMEVPFNFRLPFDWNGKNFLTLKDVKLNTKAAGLNLNASADVERLKIKAEGQAQNISLSEIGRMFAPEYNLQGEKGYVNFSVDTLLSGDVLSNTVANIDAEAPSISAMGMKIIDSLSAHIALNKKQAPKISLGGLVFGGKLFARGQAAQDNQGNMKPEAVISLVNLDVPTLIRTFPALASSIKRPSGKITISTTIADNLDVKGKLTSNRLTANGITLSNILANFFYSVNKNSAELENFSALLGKGTISATANADLNTSLFNFNAAAKNISLQNIPELKDVAGSYNLDAEASGNFSDLNTIKANAVLNARNVGYAGTPVGYIYAPVSLANNILKISKATLALHGGSLGLDGSVNINNPNNPAIDLTASTQGINLKDILEAYKLQDKSMPVTGNLKALVRVKGPLKSASVYAYTRAYNVKVGSLVDVPYALIEGRGNTKKVTLSTFDAKINGSNIKGNGAFNFDQKNFANSSIGVYTTIRHLDLKPILKAAMGSAPVTGVVDANLKLVGTIAQPELQLNLLSPIYYGASKIEDIAVSLRSPEANHFAINTKAKLENFKPEADIDLKQQGNLWVYNVTTKPLDLASAIESQAPAAAGIVKGSAVLSVKGSTKENSPINLKATAHKITILDKIVISDINLPVVFSPAKNKVEMKKAFARLSDGDINLNADVDLTKTTWEGKLNVAHLDFGKLAGEFLPEGELAGKVNSEVVMKGRYGVMPTSFANGSFTTTPGYLHKMKLIDSVSPTKKISFEKISGTFFWNGSDLFLNPGTGARADNNEPLYRYFHISGPLGIPGKGLKLVCEGRFDLKILDRLLGAMKGVFQYMTGGLAKNVLRDAAGRVLGVKRKDFQNVSFTIANNWDELRLLNLTITKPIEDFLPIDILNKDQEKQKETTQFTLQLKIPTGQGDKSAEEESTSDQIKQQIIDNLFKFNF